MPTHVVMPKPSADVGTLADHARRIVGSEHPMRRSPGDNAIRFRWSGYGMCIPIPMERIDDYSNTPDEEVDAIMKGIACALLHEIEHRTDEERRARRKSLRNALQAQFAIDLPLFVDCGVDHAEQASMACATPWAARSVLLTQMETPPLVRKRMREQLPPARNLPTACEADMDVHEDGSMWICLRPFRVETTDPWKIDPVETMRRIANASSPWEEGVAL